MQDALNIQQKLINAYQTQQASTDPIVPEKAIVCPDGYKLVGGKCIKEGTTEIVCPTGYKLVGENCIKEGTTETVCPTGYNLVGGKCIKEGTTEIVCPTGYKLVGENCIKEGNSIDGATVEVAPQGPCGPSKPYYNYYTGECVASQADVKPRSVTTTTATSTGSSSTAGTNTALNSKLNTGGTTANLHLEELARIAQATALANAINKITQSAGSVAGNHYKDLNKIAEATAKANAAAAAKNKGANTVATSSMPFGGQNIIVVPKSGGSGSSVQVKSAGGLINPMRFAFGGFAKGTDTVPAMLTPGEFIMSKYAVDAHGINAMKAINSGESVGGAVYNNTYTLTVNARTNANPNEIAQAVMSTIKQVDDRRIRGVSLNGRA